MKNVLILGGAGFIGSNLVKKFCDTNHNVTVIDAFFEFTGSNINNLKNYIDRINLIRKRVEDCLELDTIFNKNELIIDSMGWTAHHEAINNPKRDIDINLISHITVINALKNIKGKSVIYLGSRAQYGSSPNKMIKEDDKMLPEDVQGINKLSAEHFYRVYSKFYKFNILSLRLPNCYGVGQVFNGKDIGLIGGFIKDALQNKTIEVYGSHRKRSILYVQDLSDIVYKLKDFQFTGFNAININGSTIEISELAEKIVDITMSGDVIVKSMPDDIINIDMGSATLDESKLNYLVKDIKFTDTDIALRKTINHFKDNL